MDCTYLHSEPQDSIGETMRSAFIYGVDIHIHILIDGDNIHNKSQFVSPCHTYCI